MGGGGIAHRVFLTETVGGETAARRSGAGDGRGDDEGGHCGGAGAGCVAGHGACGVEGNLT